MYRRKRKPKQEIFTDKNGEVLKKNNLFKRGSEEFIVIELKENVLVARGISQGSSWAKRVFDKMTLRELCEKVGDD